MAVRDVVRAGMQRAALAGMLGMERLRSGVTYNPLSRQYRTDPYPLYRKLHERDPRHRSQLAGGWVFSRYDDIAEVLRDPRFIVDQRKVPRFQKWREERARAGIEDPDDPDNPSILTLDPPDHTRLRALVSKAFTPRMVEGLRPRIEAIVDEQLDGIRPGDTFDLMERLAQPLPVIVIAEMLGVPANDRERFKRWSDDIVRSLGFSSIEDERVASRASRELRQYFRAMADERRREPREDLLTALLAAEQEGDRLSTIEMLSMCNLLLVAGHETTTNLIGNGYLALLQHGDQLEALRGEPGRMGAAVEELLRYDSPVQMTSRFAGEDAAVNGHAVKQHQQVILLLGSANRDPRRFPDPDRLDVAREDVRHLSFSHGIHYCLGAPLARLEGQVALNALLQRFPEARLAADRSKLRWGNNLILHGLEHLPMRV